jgi:hypothetical protein
VLKDRTGKFQDAIIEKPGEEFGRDLLAWLNDGAEPKQRQPHHSDSPPKSSMPKPSAKAVAVIAKVAKLLRSECDELGYEIDIDKLSACIYGAHDCHIEDINKAQQICVYIRDEKRVGLARVCNPVAQEPETDNGGDATDYGDSQPVDDFEEPQHDPEPEPEPETKPNTKAAAENPRQAADESDIADDLI